MTQLLSVLHAWYENDRSLYAYVSVATMLIVGVLVGLLMDWIGRRAGVDTSALHHHREKVK